MAAVRRKPKATVKRKKAPARKPATRKKVVLKKKAAAKKPAKRAAPGQSPAARPAPKPRPAPAPVVPRGPLPGEERVGFVTHYYGHLSVAAIRLESGGLTGGGTLRPNRHNTQIPPT